MKKHYLILALFIIVIIVFGLINSFRIFKNPTDAPDSTGEYLVSAEEERLVNNNPASYSIGTSSPVITIVEFADFACPYCKNTFSTIREMSVKYGDRIKIVFRHYPIISEYSILLAQAAECAGEQGKFWAMHDTLFLNQGVDSADELSELARQIGLKENEFDACLSAQKYLEKIASDFSTGQALEITGTPTWYINNIHIAGDIPAKTFFELIDNLLIQSNK